MRSQRSGCAPGPSSPAWALGHVPPGGRMARGRPAEGGRSDGISSHRPSAVPCTSGTLAGPCVRRRRRCGSRWTLISPGAARAARVRGTALRGAHELPRARAAEVSAAEPLAGPRDCGARGGAAPLPRRDGPRLPAGPSDPAPGSRCRSLRLGLHPSLRRGLRRDPRALPKAPPDGASLRPLAGHSAPGGGGRSRSWVREPGNLLPPLPRGGGCDSNRIPPAGQSAGSQR